MSPARSVEARLPDFLVIGQAKCGTTTVCEALRRHPGVFFSDPKEPHYFTWDDPALTREWYESLFADALPGQAVGEGSTSYTRPDVYRECAERIAEAIPDARLVHLVRDPIARVESDWKMRVREGRATWNDINRSLEDNPEAIEHGFYWRNLSGYRECFPEEQLLLVFLEDLAADPDATLARIFRHVGVASEVDVSDPGRANAAEAKRREGSVLGLVRTLGLHRLARAALPSWLTRRLRRKLSSSWRYEANWDPAYLADLQARYREASRPLLDYCGRSPDVWSYEPSGSVRSPGS